MGACIAFCIGVVAGLVIGRRYEYIKLRYQRESNLVLLSRAVEIREEGEVAILEEIRQLTHTNIIVWGYGDYRYIDVKGLRFGGRGFTMQSALRAALEGLKDAK
jgi:hypothetical protein